ncbi:MAG: threonine--tRNA ligase, partial [Nanoarchaeota archaeon]
DGKGEEFKKGVTGLEIAKKIGERLAMAALAIEVDGVVQDLSTPIEKDSKIRILTFKDREGIEVFRHSSAHLLANAVVELFPEAKLTIGPVVEEGFYYDIDHQPFKPEDLEKIEKRMKEIADRKVPVERIELTKAEALKMFKDNPYKVELIKEITDKEKITAYKQGKFVDLCKGPHVLNTSVLKAFKLTKMSSAYWRADAKNKSLQRIYGISFPDKKDLDNVIKMTEEAEKRNHRTIGRDMDLFSTHEESPGSIFWHPKGKNLYETLVGFVREENKMRNYSEIATPVILDQSLWKKSGHYDNFKENMYFTKVEDKDFAVKPMNCPGGLLIYKARMHSYRELPIRNAEFGLVHRHELSGVLNGLFRVRAFTQDDAHVFCSEEQLQDEILDMINYAAKVYSTFGFTFETFIATRPEKSMGSDATWKIATNALIKAVESRKTPHKLKPGEGAFYGPKIEFNLKDALGRNWQCGTIQIDFSMPSRFEATYEASDGTKKIPVMIHRAILGSIERFLGVLIEHYGGKFPLWLNPNQIRILPIADRHISYADEVYSKLFTSGFRVEVDKRAESTPKKVRDAEMQHFNYILVVGDKELQNKTINIRTRDNKILGEVKVDEFLENIKQEVEDKK